ncbi:ABC transporter ATP-binding protein [Candidatus Bathycorpusculum sp.]|uniref:energy-coupling factor ABC transporter ATP-binding protein n=1 Tax=Candidatus Bathycorpusculum sp. TaxID=2994959 RepID=UPI0028311D2A|nr:energy-coupling factor ABC transporter ATP-binding protein [Candidatus Termitimicrobium sp.]MCL2430982.1 energy-coupling factor ABC transporter ATP-binding protein [Candidatus Termitimicrobium sp.]
MVDSIISIHDVKFNYPAGIAALKGLTFEVAQGERVALLGPNGSGKSTLILLIAGLLIPTSGDIRVFGEKTNSKNFQRLRSRIGIVFQDPDDQLFTPSVIEDVEYGPKNLKLPDTDIKIQSAQILEKMGITHLKNRPPHRLSFGEKKKVSLATALVLKPELLILDEPTANLDLVSRRNLIDTLNELSRAGTTIIVSTHDAEAIPELADRIVVISHGLKLGEGKTSEVLQNKDLLEQSGLEPPTIVNLFTELKNQGLIKKVPLTLEEGKEELIKILKTTL